MIINIVIVVVSSDNSSYWNYHGTNRTRILWLLLWPRCGKSYWSLL